MSSAPYPVSFCLYWSSEPDVEDTPTAHVFEDEATHNAFFRGINETEGWFGAEFVENGAYYANKDGELVERRGANTQSKPNARYVVWGENPEPGTRAQVYEFATAQEAQSFQEGVEAMVGWSRYFTVPDETYKPYSDAKTALAALPEEGRAALSYYFDRDEDAAESFDILFVSPTGAFVSEDWLPGGEIFNLPLSKEEWRDRFNATLDRGYATSIEDAGLDEKDVERWRNGPSSRFPEEAADAYATKYDLSPRAQDFSSRPPRA